MSSFIFVITAERKKLSEKYADIVFVDFKAIGMSSLRWTYCMVIRVQWSVYNDAWNMCKLGSNDATTHESYQYTDDLARQQACHCSYSYQLFTWQACATFILGEAYIAAFASRDYAMWEKVLTCLNLKVSKLSCLRGTPPRRVAFSKGS